MTELSAHPPSRGMGQVMRFLVLGGANTVLTYAIFVGLGLVIEAWIAYTIAFAIGLVVTSLGSSSFVFRAHFDLARISLFIGCYVAIYAVGRLVIWLLDPQGLEALLLSSVLVLIATTPLIFIAGRFVFKTRQPDAALPNTLEEDQS